MFTSKLGWFIDRVDKSASCSLCHAVLAVSSLLKPNTSRNSCYNQPSCWFKPILYNIGTKRDFNASCFCHQRCTQYPVIVTIVTAEKWDPPTPLPSALGSVRHLRSVSSTYSCITFLSSSGTICSYQRHFSIIAAAAGKQQMFGISVPD